MSEPKTCARCNDEPAGDGGILGARCLAEVSAQDVAYWYGKAPADPE